MSSPESAVKTALADHNSVSSAALPLEPASSIEVIITGEGRAPALAEETKVKGEESQFSTDPEFYSNRQMALRNVRQAEVERLKLEADKNDAQSQWEYAMALTTRLASARDFELVRTYLTLAAEQKHPAATYDLMTFYCNTGFNAYWSATGLELPERKKRAFQYLKKAVELHWALAYSQIAEWYLEEIVPETSTSNRLFKAYEFLMKEEKYYAKNPNIIRKSFYISHWEKLGKALLEQSHSSDPALANRQEESRHLSDACFCILKMHKKVLSLEKEIAGREKINQEARDKFSHLELEVSKFGNSLQREFDERRRSEEVNEKRIGLFFREVSAYCSSQASLSSSSSSSVSSSSASSSSSTSASSSSNSAESRKRKANVDKQSHALPTVAASSLEPQSSQMLGLSQLGARPSAMAAERSDHYPIAAAAAIPGAAKKAKI